MASIDTPIAPDQSTITLLTYTPTRWDFSIAAACQTSAPQQLEIIIDDGYLPYTVMDCGVTPTFRGLPDKAPRNDAASRGFWQSQGRDVRLNHPMTITVKVGQKTTIGNIIRSGPATATGSAAVGVYLPD